MTREGQDEIGWPERDEQPPTERDECGARRGGGKASMGGGRNGDNDRTFPLPRNE